MKEVKNLEKYDTVSVVISGAQTMVSVREVTEDEIKYEKLNGEKDTESHQEFADRARLVIE